MKKLNILFLLLILYLIYPPLAISDAYYLIMLKNGGSLSTPMYWSKGGQMYFFYAGGTVGIEKEAIDRIEKYERETGDYASPISDNTVSKESFPLPSITEKAQGQDKLPEANGGGEKVNIADYKKNKDKLVSELNQLLEKQREAASKGDKEAKAKIGEEIVRASNQVYKLTDEVKAKNKGKLPEGW